MKNSEQSKLGLLLIILIIGLLIGWLVGQMNDDDPTETEVCCETTEADLNGHLVKNMDTLEVWSQKYVDNTMPAVITSLTNTQPPNEPTRDPDIKDNNHVTFPLEKLRHYLCYVEGGVNDTIALQDLGIKIYYGTKWDGQEKANFTTLFMVPSVKTGGYYTDISNFPGFNYGHYRRPPQAYTP